MRPRIVREESLAAIPAPCGEDGEIWEQLCVLGLGAAFGVVTIAQKKANSGSGSFFCIFLVAAAALPTPQVIFLSAKHTHLLIIIF